MRLFLFCSDMIIPVIILGIVCYGVTQHVDVYESFIKGANSGFQTVIKIMPTMLALMIAVGILRASGLLEAIGMWIGSMTDHIGFPGELVPLTVVKMFSSSAATGLLLVAIIPAPTIDAGFTLPYWLLYAITFTGIN